MQGYDAVAKVLTTLFHGVLNDKTNKKKQAATTARGTASNATKLLKSNFQNSAQGKDRKTVQAVSVSPDASPEGDLHSPQLTA